MTAFYSICSWVLDPVGQIQVRRRAEAERRCHHRSAVIPRYYEMLCLFRQSRKGGLEAGATSGRISASPETLSTGNSGSLYLMIAKLKMSLRICVILVTKPKSSRDEGQSEAELVGGTPNISINFDTRQLRVTLV